MSTLCDLLPIVGLPWEGEAPAEHVHPPFGSQTGSSGIQQPDARLHQFHEAGHLHLALAAGFQIFKHDLSAQLVQANDFANRRQEEQTAPRWPRSELNFVAASLAPFDRDLEGRDRFEAL